MFTIVGNVRRQWYSDPCRLTIWDNAPHCVYRQAFSGDAVRGKTSAGWQKTMGTNEKGGGKTGDMGSRTEDEVREEKIIGQNKKRTKEERWCPLGLMLLEDAFARLKHDRPLRLHKLSLEQEALETTWKPFNNKKILAERVKGWQESKDFQSFDWKIFNQKDFQILLITRFHQSRLNRITAMVWLKEKLVELLQRVLFILQFHSLYYILYFHFLHSLLYLDTAAAFPSLAGSRTAAKSPATSNRAETWN